MSMDTPHTHAAVKEASDDRPREELIAQAAYLRAERRGFQGGDPVADWLEAEAEIDALMARRQESRRGAETPQAAAGAQRPRAKAAGSVEPKANAEGRAPARPAQRGTKPSSPKPTDRGQGTRLAAKEQRAEATPAEEDEHRIAEQLKAASERLEKLRPKLAKLKTGTRRELERELQKLDTLRDTLARKAGDIRRKSENKRDVLKQQAEKLLRDFKAGLERLGSRFDR